MTLLRLHRILIASSIALCLLFAAFELTHRSGGSTLRVALGAGAPVLAAAVLTIYLLRLRMPPDGQGTR